MKRVFIILTSVIIFAGCNGSSSDNKEADTKSSDSTAAAPAEANDPEVTKGLDLVAKSDCFTCHKLTETSIGPAYSAVAEKYKSMDKSAATDSIVHQIINGGAGKWGNVPMTPHPSVSKEDAQAMAHYVMSIK